MKRLTFSTFALCFGTFLLMGCAPDANKVCKKMEEVYKVSPGEAPGFLKVRDSCVASFEGKRSRRGVNSYRREADCILAATRPYEITKCMETEAQMHN
jgi:predicted transcriptional regulator